MGPRLAVTLGDPAGIGPEVILKALADTNVKDNCDIKIIGSYSVIEQTYKSIHLKSYFDIKQLDILEVPIEREIIPGRGNIDSGAASFAYLEKAIALTLAGEFDAIVTGPISKACWQAAGHKYAGQTELLAERAGIKKFAMLFVARSPHSGFLLRTLLATTHIPLSQVSVTLTPELLSAKLDLLVECLQEDFGIEKPRIALAGLNPHSGENGQLGREEKDWMIPWLETERKKRPQITLDGFIPPDTMWVKPNQAWYGISTSDRTHDAYLAMYHDQGLIPVKLMAFECAVNTTIGLPFIRTSPDHGTAFDIAGKGIANASSMKSALQFAAEFVNRRKSRKNRNKQTISEGNI
ncbi:MAG: 4-hydroxythreonine-4-phosphate dehydrogenase PdxA [Oscillatoriaceae bacterium SKW80]|nr:4-hydroxythreonine-4-phosphate dehydrogenase PdxA [Oscillatoriaceae bacterium SKYG93]MCX8120487.1 4-hydroxythreonine-4-phosphate dehydrogenase PdxA [Oscillatoriaceae bacterium SKW80]MDW8452725.1 4-hydroxythreonine-4-phosphate dehydrogenase PdxA [Oscillatoriaceae cyanobacterium SKYGB_i_bin93]HIK27205.1 4-hydroxythreonine-4-phosphate dehydrogenase PdxA [Oscillatoriaceae cyanobacterium M7585_C2015_266]